MRVILLVLFILLIAEIIVLLFFYHDQRLVKYNDSSFVSHLRYKLFEINNNSSYEIIYPEFEELLTRAREKDSDFGEYFIQYLLSIFTFVTLVADFLLLLFFFKCVEIA